MANRFRETRVSKNLFIAAILLLLTSIITLLFYFGVWAALGVATPLAMVLFALCRLSLEVEDDCLKLVYGFGLFTQTVPYVSVERCEIVQNNYITWVYNPEQMHVLKIYLRNGGAVIVAIGDPRELMSFVTAKMRGN